MTPFAINLILALVWAALFNDFSFTGLLVGFFAGFIVLGLLQPLFENSRYTQKLVGVIGLIVYFLWELVVSSFKVAWDVLTPTHLSSPGIVSVPMRAQSDVEITTLANLVSLTPGSLSIDISQDRRTLLVHAMFVDDPDLLRHEIRHGMEQRVLEALR